MLTLKYFVLIRVFSWYWKGLIFPMSARLTDKTWWQYLPHATHSTNLLKTLRVGSFGIWSKSGSKIHISLIMVHQRNRWNSAERLIDRFLCGAIFPHLDQPKGTHPAQVCVCWPHWMIFILGCSFHHNANDQVFMNSPTFSDESHQLHESLQ